MLKVVFPEPRFKIEKKEGKDCLFDGIRKQWIVLTDEEWVRQNFIQFLVQELKYPETLIAVEKEMQLGELKKRFDILVYNSEHRPWLLVECKAQDIDLDEKVFEQVLRYNISLPCNYLLITNGQYTIGWERTGDKLIELNQFPVWKKNE